MAVVAFHRRCVRYRAADHPRLGRRRAGARVRAEGSAVLGERVARAAGVRRGEVAVAARHHVGPAGPSTGGDLVRRAGDARHPGPGRARRLLQQVPPSAAAGRHRSGDHRRGDPDVRPVVRGDPGGHPAADPRVHGARRLDDGIDHEAALGRADQARQPLRRPDRGPAHPAGVRTREGPGRGAAAERAAAPLRDHADAAGLLPVRPRPGAPGHDQRRAHRRHRGLPGGVRRPRPRHGPVRADPRAGGVPAGAAGRRPLSRRRRRPRRCRVGVRADRSSVHAG